MKLLFVCTGNICRSPTAEGIMKYICNKKKYDNIYCESAGLYNYHIGSSPDNRAIRIAQQNNVNISSLRARKIKKSDFQKFDLIIGMDKGHILELKKMEKITTKIRLFLNFTNEYKNCDVPDPYYGTIEDFK